MELLASVGVAMEVKLRQSSTIYEAMAVSPSWKSVSNREVVYTATVIPIHPSTHHWLVINGEPFTKAARWHIAIR
jgi:ABC-type polysaccharide transport system permease subunit